MWYDIYSTLNLKGGTIKFICEDDEDMIEISYPDGMLIDVGKASDGKYYVTVVATKDLNGWEHPLCVNVVVDKKNLFDIIQNTIEQYRK